MCLCYFGSRQCCCFPVVRWLDSGEDYITLEMSSKSMPSTFFVLSRFLPYLSCFPSSLTKMPPDCFIQISYIPVAWCGSSDNVNSSHAFPYESEICTALLADDCGCCVNSHIKSSLEILDMAVFLSLSLFRHCPQFK